jgi:hypothetical protein
MSFWSEITPLELALAVRSRSVGAHSDNKLAEGGSEEE